MGKAAAALVLALVMASLPAGALPSPSPGPFLPHALIHIESNADFTSANGVVSGSGSIADPFVIAGWSVTASSGSTGILVRNVTSAFVIRDNSVSAGLGIHVDATSSIGVILNNKLVVRGVGVSVTNADAIVLNNSFVGDLRYGGSNLGISLTQSNSLVEGNAFIYAPYAILAHQGSPIIRCNDIHDDSVRAGIKVEFTTNATIECNSISSCQGGIISLNAIGTVIVNNTVTTCTFGIDATLTKDAVIANNTIQFSAGTQLNLWHSSGVLSGNLVIDGKADGVVMDSSPMLVANNTITANVAAGLRLRLTAADVEANVISKNSMGIVLESSSVPHLRANVMTNNTVGIDVPYASRQTIVWMQANIVNGVNIDGTLNASQQVYFYHAANVVISSQVRDSGFSSGYFGSISAQGNLVLYDADNVLVEGTVISHANVGVTAVNAFNVVISGTLITDTIIGVSAKTVLGVGQTPACAVSVKNSTINITVDPIGTIGVDAHACLINVQNTTISTVATGIWLDADSTGEIRDNLIMQTAVGLEVSARSGVTVTGNTVTTGNVGARFSGTRARVTDNTFTQLAVGVQLTGGANLTFQRNTITANGEGVVDMGPCSGGTIHMMLCGSLQARGNTFANNDRDGLRINGSSQFQDDVFSNNGANGARLASAVLVRVAADHNANDGVSLSGTFVIRDSAFFENGNNGVSLAGQGDVRRSNFSFNQNAGIFTTASYLMVLDATIAHNFDGIALDDVATVGPLPSVSTTALLRALPDAQGADTLDVHRSALLGNERDAIRAGFVSVNATHNYWGGGAPALDVLDTVGAFQNGVSPLVRFLPWYTDAAMTTTGPVAGT
ncbi:MAG: right-handed parallel beta-helix repeat-containing protein [Candidatus Thermoplasmatota archaeon]